MSPELTSDPTTATAPSPRSRRRWPWWTWAIAGMAVVHPLAYWLARWNWWADLIAQFRVPALVVSLLAAAAIARRRSWWAVPFVGIALIQAAPSVSLSVASPVPPAPRAPRLRVFSANVLLTNLDRDAVTRAIEAERPDVVGLVEVDAGWIAGLQSIRRDYPHRIERATGVTGLALWSKRPLTDARIVTPEGSNPFATALVSMGDTSVRLWLIHTKSPQTRTRREEVGFAELDDLAARFASEPGPRLVFGDFNTTDGSPHFGALLAKSGLRDGRVGFGAQPSWPTWSPLRITIDHTLVSPDLAIIGRRLGLAIGSDHLPVVFEVAPAASTAAASASERSSSP